MPIPLFLIGIGAASAALGIGTAAKAGFDNNKANNTNKHADSIVKYATKKIELYRKNSNDAIRILGKRKLEVLDDDIKPFLELFEKLHNVDFEESEGLFELEKFRIDKESMLELKELQNIASSMIGGVASGAALGAVTAFGAYGAAMTFGAASTGTAIASLSGVAASNATLAFLGGGSLAAGGLGMAGGAAVLGGLVAGPALAVLGIVMNASANAKKEEAYSNLANAKEFSAEMDKAAALCKGIRMRAAVFERSLIRLSIILEELVYSLRDIVDTAGTDYSTYNDAQKSVVAASLSTAGAIKAMLDTPILNKDGTLAYESERLLHSIDKIIDKK